MALPNIQQAQYGDRTSLEKLGGYRRTNNPASDVNGMKQMGGGRPRETDPVKLAMRQMQGGQGGRQQAAPDPETERYTGMFGSLGELYKTALKWQRIASQPGAGPYTKWWAAQAIRDFNDNFFRVRKETPFFDEV